MLKKVFALLTLSERRKGIRVALSVLLRTLLDFAGIAALIPIVVLLLGDKPNTGKSLILCLGVLIFVVAKYLLFLTLTKYQNRYLLSIYKRLSYFMFCSYYKRGLLFLKQKNTVRLSNDVNFICYAFSLNVLSTLMTISGEILLVVMMVTAMMIWAPVTGVLLCLAFIPMIVFNLKVVRKRSRQFGKAELDARRQQNCTVVEAFRGYAELEVNNAFSAIESSFSSGLDVINECRMRMQVINSFPSLLSEISVVIGLALLMCISSGDVKLISGVFAVAAFRLMPAVKTIMSCWTTLQANTHCIDTIYDSMSSDINTQSTQTEPEIQEVDKSKEDLSTLSFSSTIKVDDITFAFPDGGVILKDFSCTIKKGERIGFKGVSGSGKSTLFNILLGFYPLTAGRVLIDNIPLSNSNLALWHKLVGYVPQEIFIVHGSLAENVALGQKEIDEDRIMSVLEQVQLKDWVDTLPEGVNTSLGEFGSRMSGGQKQRIGIARALYKNVEVLFFDEATSALDSKTENEINLAIENLSRTHKELTILVIAHRETSLAFCDRIIDMTSAHV